jgi:hypothetical protein
MRTLLLTLACLSIWPSLHARAADFVDREAIETSGYCAGVLTFTIDLAKTAPPDAEHQWYPATMYTQALNAVVGHAKRHYLSVGLTEDRMKALIARGILETIETQNVTSHASRLEVWNRGSICMLLGLALDVGSRAARDGAYADARAVIAPLVAAGE